MKTYPVSTEALQVRVRDMIRTNSNNASKSHYEVSSGRYHEPGLKYGSQMGSIFSFRNEYDRMSAIVDSNGLVASRLATTQTIMDNIHKNANHFVAAMTANTSGQVTARKIKSSAEAELSKLLGEMTADYGGVKLFSGINTDETPLVSETEFRSTLGTIKGKFEAAVREQLNLAPGTVLTPGNTDSLSSEDLQKLVDDHFSVYFTDPDKWKYDESRPADEVKGFSHASDTPLRARIAPNEVTNASVTVNAKGIRDLMAVYSVASTIDFDQFGQAKKEHLFRNIISQASTATDEVITLEKDLGIVEAKVASQSAQMKAQLDILNRQINDLERVDANEAMIEFMNFGAQIERSYRAAIKLDNLSLLNFI